MAKRTIPLDGAWRLEGRRTGEAPPEIEIRGEVTGQVHLDLLREGLIPDPFWRDQAEACQWVETWHWTYRREFDLPEGASAGWDVLEFEGLDTFATVLVNGQEAGRAANMFVARRFGVSSLLRPGRNAVEVRFTPPGEALADKDMRPYASCFSDDRVYARKMQCAYGWDWVHRFVSAGVWRPARLVCYDGARLDSLFVWTERADANEALVHIDFDLEVEPGVDVTARTRVTGPDGRVVKEWESREWRGEPSYSLRITEPQLWQPNGAGDQPLYRCEVEAVDAEGEALDSTRSRFGIRTVELEEISDEVGRSFTFKINGERVFCQGGNWVPADPFPARVDRAWYERLLGVGAEGGVNMLRAWGGGIYEAEDFWDVCDELGIMVSQDFLMACAEYPEEDPEFLAALRAEFAQAIQHLRNHPSLVMWFGNNELGMNADPATDFAGKKVAEEVSGPLVERMDPSRPFKPTSPFGGNPNNAAHRGDSHISAWNELNSAKSDMEDYRERIDAVWGRFLSEYAVPGAPPWHTLLRFMTEEDIADPGRAMWDFHTKDNPYNGIEDRTLFGMLEHTAKMLYGETDDPRLFVRRLEYVQYEWARLTAEAARRRQWDCSGLLFWMYNDCWPASGWSVIDYWGGPKAGYYGMKRGFQPVIAAIEPGAETLGAWLVNGGREPRQVTASFHFRPWTGEPAWGRRHSLELKPHESLRIDEAPRADLGQAGVLVCDVEAEVNRDRASFFAGMPRDMAPPPVRLEVERTNHGEQGAVTISTDRYARVVTLDAPLDYSDNYFDMLPGERRTVTWRARDGAYDGPLPVTCWNGAGENAPGQGRVTS